MSCTVIISHLHASAMSGMLELLQLSVREVILLWSQVASSSNLAGDVGTQSPMPASDASAAPKVGSLGMLHLDLSSNQALTSLVAKPQLSLTRAPVAITYCKTAGCCDQVAVSGSMSLPLRSSQPAVPYHK